MRASSPPVLIIHSGAGGKIPGVERQARLREALGQIVEDAYALLARGAGATEAAVRACELLEDNPLFNAGRGSKLQADGRIRMSAGLMDGHALRFSGVVNVQGLRHPIRLARDLADESSRVLSDGGAKQYAKELGLEFRSPFTPERVAEFKKARRGKTGTVGAVAIDRRGHIAAATSTGGRGMELPGRVSDTPTVAGNYATALMGISATGIGEQIVDFALCAKIATRVEDGLTLREAFQKTFAQARRRGYEFGAVGLARDGSFMAMTTTRYMPWALVNADRRHVAV